MALDPHLLQKLTDCVGEQHVLLGDDVRARAKHVWNPEPRQAAAIVRPADTGQVSTILRACCEARQRVVTHGGLTGLVDGDRSDENDLVLSLERMRQIEQIDPIGKTLQVQAGCVLESVQQTADKHGLSFGLDLGARGSCTIGGNIATNAGGLSVLRHGMTREQVLGLEVVLMDGTVLSSMNTLMKNNAGYDLKHLFIGSEGTLGVITRAVLRLRPATSSCNTALLACPSFTDVTHILQHLDTAMAGQLNAFEVLWKSVVAINTDEQLPGTVKAPLTLNEPYYVIAETRGANIEHDATLFEQALQHCFKSGWASDGVFAQSSNERANLWAIRENIELMLEHDPNYVFDISLPISAMDHYVQALDIELQAVWPNTKLFTYGHMADGNLHIIVAPPAIDSPDEQYQHVNRLVYEPLQSLGGSISAEHGIGFSKKPWLSLSRSETEIKLMQSLKQLFDPHQLLNHGRIVDPC